VLVVTLVLAAVVALAQQAPSAVPAAKSSTASAVPPAASPLSAPPNDHPENVDQNTWDWILRGMYILQILIGLAMCFAGYRLFKPALFVAGFVLFFYICLSLLKSKTSLAIWIDIAISAGAGVIGGVLMILVWKVGAFIMGFMAGALLAFMVVSFTPLSEMIQQSGVAGSAPFWIFLASVVGLGILVGIAAIFLVKHVIIFSSAINGAINVGIAVSYLASLKTFNTLITLFDSTAVPENKEIKWNDLAGWPLWLLLGGIVILAVAGVVVQYKFTSRNFDHDPAKKPKGEEEFPLLIQNM